MPAAAATAHDFSFTSIDGGDLPLADYKGKVVLLVNTASMCGFTANMRACKAYGQNIRIVALSCLACPVMILVGKSWIRPNR